MRQPVKLHGAGLRSHADICHQAYLGALEQAAPYMASRPTLSDLMGGLGSWGEEADPRSRWVQLLASGHADGVQLRQSWSLLQRSAQEAAIYLGDEMTGTLVDQVEEAGWDSGGKLRQKLVEEGEMLKGRLLLHALEQHPDREARPVWSWKERDKHSSTFVLCLPSTDTSLSAAEFGEAFAALLCLPSPACQPRLGETVTRRDRVDCFGDRVMNAVMRGDGWRRRHDAMKLKLRRLLTWAGIGNQCEVFNLFADCIPQEGLNRLERGRRRQGLVPDFKVQGEEGEGSILCELKFISASRTWYRPNQRAGNSTRAVDLRAGGLTAEYTRKARDVDQRYGGAPQAPVVQQPGAPEPHVVGRVEARLNSFGPVRGWVFGSWGEASEEVHGLVQRIASSRLEVAETQPGRRGPSKSRAAELANYVSYVRRQLSFTAVQQQAKLLLDRLQLIGDGASDAARRRERAEQAEAAARRERRAQAVCLRQGRAIRRHGFGKLE